MVGMFAVIFFFGLRLVPFALEWLARHDNREAFLLVVFLAVLFAAWAMHQAGLSMALGAFLMGMLLSGSRYNMQIRALIEPYKGLLMSLFFVAVGMSIDLGELAGQPAVFFQHTAVQGDEWILPSEHTRDSYQAVVSQFSPSVGDRMHAIHNGFDWNKVRVPVTGASGVPAVSLDRR